MGPIIGTHLFDTAIGECGLAWSEAGVTRLILPGSSPDSARRILAEHTECIRETDPPARIARVIEVLREYFRGAPAKLDTIPLDLSRCSEFERSVYDHLLRVPRGGTCTYGDLAREVGTVGDARAVGRAVGANPCPVIVPCHRVLAAGGKPGGFSAPGGLETKARLLALEGVLLPGSEPTLF